jgi:ferritin-like metal-binding protein YciE
MTPSEIIKLQALKLKATIDGHHPQIIDSVLNNPENKEEVKKDFRNVCALITQGQFEALESLCSLLDLSKREVISMALGEFIEMANDIVSEVNPFEAQDAAEAFQE